MSSENAKTVVDAEEFRLLDKEGRVRVRIFLEENEPKVALFSKDDKKRAAIGLLPTGEAGVALYDENGVYHFLINVSAGGTPDLSIRDRSGREVMIAQREEPSEPEIDIIPQVKHKGLRWLLKK
jgi:hypothetical protein